MTRGLHYPLTLLLVLGLNFVLPRMLPGDPLTALYGEQVVLLTPEFRQQLIQSFGLDHSLVMQFGHYLANLAIGDLGYSIYYQAPVSLVIGPALLWTALLCGVSFVASTVIGIFLGVELACQRQRPWSAGVVGGCLMLGSLPGFLLGVFLLMIFSLKLGLFPLSGALNFIAEPMGLGARLWDVGRHLALPALTLMLWEIPAVALLLRTSAIKTLKAPFLTTAQARGLGSSRIKYRYLARNALLPLITRLGLRLGLLWAAALPVEIVFAYPGAGQLLFQALLKRDYPLLQGLFLVITLAVLAGNALADGAYRLADPRLRGYR